MMDDSMFEGADEVPNMEVADAALSGVLNAINEQDHESFRLIAEMLGGNALTLMGVLLRLAQASSALKDVAMHLLAGWAVVDSETWVAMNGDTKPVHEWTASAIKQLQNELTA